MPKLKAKKTGEVRASNSSTTITSEDTHSKSMNTAESFRKQLYNYSCASVPFVWVTTPEERRCLEEIYAAFTDDREHKVMEWDGLLGLRFREKAGKYNAVGDSSIKDIIEKIKNWPEGQRIFVMKDFHHWIEAPGLIRGLRNLIAQLKSKGSTVVFLSAVTKIPPELTKDMTMLDFMPPGAPQIEQTISFLQASVKVQSGKEFTISEDVKTDLVCASLGLTANEIENAITVGLVKHKGFNQALVDEVFAEKVRQLKSSGNITYVESNVDFDSIGGMPGLKSWIKLRCHAFSKEARTFGLPAPRGILLCGVPGCGKSLLAKAIANELGVPMFQADIGALFGKFVGETEERFRSMLQTVDSIGRCVLFIDELEKGLSSSAVSGAGDTGTSSRSFGTLLTWLSDHTSEVFVVGTSNNFTILPPPLIRKGRFDEVFWIDLPTATEREEIIKVQLIKQHRDPSKFDLAAITKATHDFAGSEIEQLIIADMFTAFNDGADITTESLIAQAKTVIPHAATNAEALEDMRDKAKNKLVAAQSLKVVVPRQLVAKTV